MVLTVSFALSPVTRLCCHRRCGLRFVKTRSGRRASANLTPALGRQNHTTSPSASASVVSSPFDRSRALSTRPATTSRAQCCRVHRIPPYVRDDRETPLCGTGWRGYRFDLGQAGNEIFLQMGLDRKIGDLPVGQISRTVRRGSKSEGARLTRACR
jgi:hypothetical protein